MNKRLKFIASLFLIFTFIIDLCACSINLDDFFYSENTAVSDGEISVHFLDVGQGDSTFIELTDGRTMLIDAGTADYGQNIIEYIKGMGYTKIDYLVATHPHADHIGGMTDVVESFDIGAIYMPDVDTTTKTYENLLEAIYNKSLKIKTAKSGGYIIDEPDLTAKILAPVTIYENDLNNCSIVIKLSYDDTSFLFTGDAEKKELEQITGDISADVLKVGHHGSNTSTTEDFLLRVIPYYAVISCGKNNEYGHPHSEVLNLLDDFDAEVYRTDKDGTVRFTSDGQNLYVETEKAG